MNHLLMPHTCIQGDTSSAEGETLIEGPLIVGVTTYMYVLEF